MHKFIPVRVAVLMGWQIKLADTKRLGEKRYSAGRLFTLSGKRECRGM
jgi:hypothetical protein